MLLPPLLSNPWGTKGYAESSEREREVGKAGEEASRTTLQEVATQPSLVGLEPGWRKRAKP